MIDYQAAYRIDGSIFLGRSHLEIISQLTEAHKTGNLLHGYTNIVGHFFESVEGLFNSMKDIILIRHAETFYNINQTEDLDSDLTDVGENQSDNLAKYMNASKVGEGFVGLVS